LGVDSCPRNQTGGKLDGKGKSPSGEKKTQSNSFWLAKVTKDCIKRKGRGKKGEGAPKKRSGSYANQKESPKQKKQNPESHGISNWMKGSWGVSPPPIPK